MRNAPGTGAATSTKAVLWDLHLASLLTHLFSFLLSLSEIIVMVHCHRFIAAIYIYLVDLFSFPLGIWSTIWISAVRV